MSKKAAAKTSPARINPGLASLVRPIDSVRLDPKNAMSHPEKNLAAIRASLTRHGQQKAIVADKTGIVLAGNGTLEAARALGWTEIAVVEYDGDSASLARAYAIEDNQTAKLAEWDIPALQLSLDEIRLDFPDLGDLGFDEKALRTVGVSAHTRQVGGPGDIEEVDLDEFGGDDVADLRAPFPYFGGKRTVAAYVWSVLGADVKHYIEPFFGSGAMLLASPSIAPLEVVNDANGFLANFWRCVAHQPDEAAKWADYPVSHVDLGARHKWLMGQRQALAESLQDPDWPGDPKIAGWWLWGQCAWIGSGWCDWFADKVRNSIIGGQIPSANSGSGVLAIGKIPAVGTGSGVQRGALAAPVVDGDLTPAGEVARQWLRRLQVRMGRVRVVHGDWSRCLNHSYGKEKTAVVLDPPYKGTEDMYGNAKPVSDEVAEWARNHPHLRVALFGIVGEHEMPGWTAKRWDRGRLTFGGSKTTSEECIWFSPACDVRERKA